MSIMELKEIRREFEEINLLYRRTFSFDDRMKLIERVKNLLVALKFKGVEGMDVRDGVLK